MLEVKLVECVNWVIKACLQFSRSVSLVKSRVTWSLTPSTGEMDGMKSSPANGPGTPREDLPPVSGGDMGGYSIGYQENVSACLLWNLFDISFLLSLFIVHDVY